MPQPVDMQTELARFTAVERIQALADRASLAAQQRQDTSAEENRVVIETQVQQTNEPENEEVRGDGRRRNPFASRRRRRKREEQEEGSGVFPNEEEQEERMEDAEGHRLDVSI